MNEPIVVPEGDSVGLTMRWSELLTTALEAPTSVTYQVFDRISGAPVSPVQTVPEPAATMTFAVSPAHLPAGTRPHSLRTLVVQIVGHFNTNEHTEEILVAVHKRY